MQSVVLRNFFENIGRKRKKVWNEANMEAVWDVVAAWEYFFALADGFSVGWLVTSRGETRVGIDRFHEVQDIITKEENKEVRWIYPVEWLTDWK